MSTPPNATPFSTQITHICWDAHCKPCCDIIFREFRSCLCIHLWQHTMIHAAPLVQRHPPQRRPFPRPGHTHMSVGMGTASNFGTAYFRNSKVCGFIYGSTQWFMLHQWSDVTHLRCQGDTHMPDLQVPTTVASAPIACSHCPSAVGLCPPGILSTVSVHAHPVKH